MATTAGKIAAFLAVEVVAALILVWLTWHQTDTYWRNKWLSRDAADLQAQIRQAQENAAQERDWQQKFAQVDQDYQRGLKAAQDEADRNLADYRNGIKRLRSQFTCAAGNMPDTATASGIRDAAARCGLQPADVEFLIRYGRDAEGTRQQLIAAQALLRKIYTKAPH